MTTAIKGITLDTRELDRLTKELKPKADRLLSDVAKAVEGKAKMLAPVDTAALRNSLESEKTGDLLYEVHDGVEYGIYQELGTSRMRAHPFLTPAIESLRQRFEQAWKELFK